MPSGPAWPPTGTGTTLVVLSDMRDGLPTSADESAGGDGAAAVVVGDDGPGTPVIAEYLGGASVSDEFLDRWRTAGDRRSRLWEERFGETRYVPLGTEAWEAALKDVGISADQVDRVAVTGMHGRAVKALARKLGVGDGALADDLAGDRGPDRRRPSRAWCWPPCVEQSRPGEVVAVVALADGADVLVFRTTEARSSWSPAEPVADQVAGGRRPPLRQVPVVAGHGHARASPAARAPAGLLVGGLAERGVEVRLRRVQGPVVRGGAPASVPGVDEGRRGRRHGPDRTGPTPRPPSPPTPSTGWPTRRARRSSSPSSTSTVAGGSRSS